MQISQAARDAATAIRRAPFPDFQRVAEIIQEAIDAEVKRLDTMSHPIGRYALKNEESREPGKPISSSSGRMG